jgi:hypothetical protein
MQIYRVEVIGARGELLRTVTPFPSAKKAGEAARGQKLKIPSAKVQIVKVGGGDEKWEFELAEEDLDPPSLGDADYGVYMGNPDLN